MLGHDIERQTGRDDDDFGFGIGRRTRLRMGRFRGGFGRSAVENECELEHPNTKFYLIFLFKNQKQNFSFKGGDVVTSQIIIIVKFWINSFLKFNVRNRF